MADHEPDRKHRIVCSKTSLVLIIQGPVKTTVHFSIGRSVFRRLPSWPYFCSNSHSRHLKTLPTYYEPEAEQAALVILRRLHEKEYLPDLKNASVKVLYYISLISDFLYKSQTESLLGVKTILSKKLILPFGMHEMLHHVDARRSESADLGDVDDWILLSAIADRYSLLDLKDDVLEWLALVYPSPVYDRQVLQDVCGSSLTEEQWGEVERAVLKSKSSRFNEDLR